MIYISDNWRHLICLPYNIKNLHKMAKNLNIHRCWFHNGKNNQHYDIPKKRIEEIHGKTLVASPKTLLKLMKGKILKKKDISYKIFWSEEDNEYVAQCEQFPGLTVLYEDPAKALKEVIELVDNWLEEIKNEL